MITRDPYGISHATSPWAENPYPEITSKEIRYLEDAKQNYNICRYCLLDDCYPNRSGCLLFHKERRLTAARLTLIRMWEDGASAEEIQAATGYKEGTVRQYIRLLEREKKMDPCITCKSKKICEAYGGTCNAKERYRG